jgi:DNA repair protein RadA/Sms
MAAARTLCCCRLVRSVRCNAIHVTREGKRKAAIAFQFCSGYAAAMAKPRKTYVCQACGSVSNRWQGQCADCGEWNTLTEQAAPTAFSARHDLQTGGQRIQLARLDAAVELPPRITTGIAEFDRALGGGLVAGSATLMGGDPGIGKSTLLLQASANMARAGHAIVYISGEEAADQVRLRALRLGLADAPIDLASATSVRDILTTLRSMESPVMLVIDSIQTMHSDLIEGAPGTVSQVRASAQELIRYAKESGCAVILVGHVTKDGTIAGPRVLEHMVDTVMSFEGERSHQYRILRSIKNRFGATDEIGVFAMEEAGLSEVGNPSSLFLSDRDAQMPGTSVFPALEGTRPVLVEIQALTVRLSSGATPRRAVVGWDSGRLAMVLAVLEARCGLSFSTAEVYLNVAGGYRLSDPAADMAVAAALVSALSERPLGSGTIVFGELALSGELRPVAHAGLRLREAAKLGFEKALVPASVTAKASGDTGGMRLSSYARLANLVDQLLGRN